MKMENQISKINPADRLVNVSEYYFSKKLKEVAQMNAEGKDIISLGIGSPDMPPSEKTIETLCKEARNPDGHGYMPYIGIPELRRSFARWYKKWYDVDLNPNTEIQPLIGSKEGILHVTLAFVNPGEQVLVPNPGYPTYTSLSKILGAEVVNYNLKEENGWIPDFEELENILLHSDLAEKIVNEFHNPNKKSIVPAMLAWLYYGRSYECMVEQGEELTQRKDIPKLYKWLISGMVKFIIRKSITNGMRSKEDWQVFRKQQKAIEENTLVEWAIEEDEDTDEEDTDTLSEEQPKTAGRKADTRTLSELLIERHAILIERIGTRLKTHATETDIARLFIALVEYRFMRKCPIKTFRNALHNQFKEQEIVHERGIQKAYRNLISPLGNSKKLIKDIGEDHEAIEELKAYLSN